MAVRELKVGGFARIRPNAGLHPSYTNMLVEIKKIDYGIYGDEAPRYIKVVPVDEGRWPRVERIAVRWFNPQDVTMVSPLEILAEQAE